MEEYVKIATEINKLNRLSNSLVIAIEVMKLAVSLSYEKQRVLLGIASLLLKIPKNALKDTTSISETELWSTYFNPLLSSIISDSEKNTMLRWTHKLAEDEISMRPDATITLIKQADPGENVGFGEAKIAQPTCDKAALCLDFVRLVYLGKESIDNGCLEASLCFQIHDFHIVFYLTRLYYNKLYTMTQIGKLGFPRSLGDMSSFTCPKNLQTLLQVTKALWQHYHKAKTPLLQTKSTGLGFVLHFLDLHKDRRRKCPDNFGN